MTHPKKHQLNTSIEASQSLNVSLMCLISRDICPESPPPTVALAMISLPFSCKRPTHEIKTWRDRPAGRRISGPEGSAAGTFGDGEATSRISNGIPLGYLVGGFNPFEKSNWIISPGRGENKKYLKPPLSYANVSVNGVSWFPKK